MTIETRTYRLTRLDAGMPIVYGGDRIAMVSADLAAAFAPGDRLVVVQDTGDLLHIPAAIHDLAGRAVGSATAAFGAMGGVPDAAITAFYDAFAARLADDSVWARIADANAGDVASARARGRSTTRLTVSGRMRDDMIAGLQIWRDTPSPRGRIVEAIDHAGWRIETFTAGLGVVGFVFEGRPNVFADATGVLRGGNTVVFRIGSDALGTAQAIVEYALDPALAAAGLPAGSAVLLASAERSAGWAMFSDSRLAVAVARGSGSAVEQLGAIARQAGTPVSLHGTGGAWILTDSSTPADAFAAAIYHSLDRKVCNSLNVCAVVGDRLDLVSVLLDALERAGDRRSGYRLHVVSGGEAAVPAELFDRMVTVQRAEGDRTEPLADVIPQDMLSAEWEWEETPEVTLVLVDRVDEAIDLFNTWSPRLAASLITADAAAFARFEAAIDAPFVGTGFTRWVDGQYALHRPELGLSNWQYGRLFGRGGVLSGDTVFTVRARAIQTDPDVHR